MVFLLSKSFSLFVISFRFFVLFWLSLPDLIDKKKMISILIPTYNYPCRLLVMHLQAQCERMAASVSGFSYEILVADDASTLPDVRQENERISSIKDCRYLPLSENVGRARIRNYLADQARFEWLLFIDSDAEVADEHFLKNYLQAMEASGAEVICGGVANIPKLNDPSCSLRFYYEEHVGRKRLASERMKQPCARFSTFNFLIRRSLFQMIRFNESCVHYGYEDVLFGMEIERRGARICHIDNALIHAGVERNDIFLRKTETALRTLYSLEPEFHSYVTVSRVALRLKRCHLLNLVSWSYKLFLPLMRANLLSARPSIFLFNVYKLGYYATLDSASRKDK